MIKAPINYMGSKRRLLKQLLPLFPENINTLYDLFAGGGTVSLNTKAKYYVWNDINKPLINMYDELAKLDEEEIKAIGESSKKLGSKDYFLKLREEYNNGSRRSASDLYQLIIASFNGLARFNQHGNYNMPWNNSKKLTDFYFENKNKQLLTYNQWAKKHSIVFSAKSYMDLIKNIKFNSDDFLYFDPPYTQTSAPYIDGNRSLSWTVDDDKKLLGYLDSLNELGIKFAMSNILSYREEDNQILVDWLDQHKDIKAIHLNMDYHTSTYHTKPNKSDEVLIVNY